MRNRRGFTLIELLVVTFLLGIPASIALLKFMDMRNHAIAAQMSQELRAITVAVLNYHAGTEAWPAEVGGGGAARAQRPPRTAPARSTVPNTCSTTRISARGAPDHDRGGGHQRRPQAVREIRPVHGHPVSVLRGGKPDDVSHFGTWGIF